jgi:hypothetical protein
MEQLRAAYDTEPFRPFLLRLNDGRELAVHRREYIAMTPDGGVIVVCQPDDSVSYIGISVVQGIEPLAQPAQSTVV